MITFLDTGSFPDKNGNNNQSQEAPRRRNVEEPVRRRESTPSRATSRRAGM